jgi:hypothetical protein
VPVKYFFLNILEFLDSVVVCDYSSYEKRDDGRTERRGRRGGEEEEFNQKKNK